MKKGLKIKQILRTGGLSDNEFIHIYPNIIRTNRKILIEMTSVSMLLTAAMYIISLYLPTFRSSQSVYLVGLIASFIIFLMTIAGKNNYLFTQGSVYVAQFTFLAYGLAVGVLTRPELPATTFIVMIVMLPMIFIDRPQNTIIITVLFMIIFMIGIWFTKKPDIILTDTVNIIIFGCVSIFCGTTVITTKIKEFSMEKNLHTLSTTDQLTGLKNRNCYEWMIDAYANMCEQSLCCIYIDVNGLHDLNNLLGHKAGDDMLIFIAKEVQKAFGERDTYRIGGDEYVAFAIDQNPNDISLKIKTMISAIEHHAYHVAIGCERHVKTDLDVNKLIKRAEEKMYQNKQEYYEMTNNYR